MKKTIIIPLIISLAFVLSAQAQTSTSPTVEDLQKQIQLLLSQMTSLQKEITSLKTATPAPIPTTPTVPPSILPIYSPLEIDESEVSETESAFIPPPNLTRSLFRGSRGEDVRQLQEFLAQDPSIYPDGLATGYYGIGTEAAVKKWQAKNGVPAVGVIGRQTIAKFKALYSGVTDVSIFTRPPVAVQPTSPTDLTPIPKPDPGAICPGLPTVDSCPAGEERIVTYKSAQCGVYYACKPRTSTRTDNTIATLKKISSIQTDDRYSINLYDPEGVQKFVVYNSKGAEISLGYPACRKEWSSPAISANAMEFPLKLTLSDCASSQFSATLSTSVVVKPVAEGLTFPYKFSNGKIVYSSEEARSYCYANGPGSGQSVAGECETKFGVVYTNITTTTSSAGRAVYSTDAFASCMAKYGFSAEAKQIKTWAQSSEAIPWSALTNAAQNSVPVCEKEYYGQQTIETGAAMCADGKDNDGDGFTDSADPSCVGYTTTTTQTTITTSGQSCDTALTTLLGTGCHYMYNDSLGSPIFCDNAMTKSAKRGATTTTSGCTAPTVTTTTTSPAGQKEQTWNSLGLKSWIRTDADSARIEQLKSACISVPSGANIWTPNAGLSTSVDFGMPDATKCQRASACTSGQYFDGASCITGTATTWNTTDTCSQYGSGWHSMSAGLCFDSAMQNYRATNGTLYSCSTTPTTGCSGTTTTTSTSSYACDSGLIALLGDGCHYMYNDSASNSIFCDGPMSKSAKRGDTATTASCQSPTSSTQTTLLYEDSAALCSDGIDNDRDGLIDSADSSCSSFTTTTTTSTGSCSQYGNGWHVMGDNNCYNSGMTDYRTANGTLYSCSSTPSSGCSSSSSSYIGSGACTSGQYWNGTACVTSTTSSSSCSTPSSCYDSAVCASSGWYWYNSGCWSSPQSSTTGSGSSSTTCTSGQYWNGSSCVATSPTDTTTTCPSGQYWSGSACVNSTTTSSIYDQLANQLRSMEIILRGLLGR